MFWDHSNWPEAVVISCHICNVIVILFVMYSCCDKACKIKKIKLLCFQVVFTLH